MNSPRCPKGRLATMVCVTQTCHRYAFMCSKCDDSLCQKGHQFCKTMLWSSALERIYNYQKYEIPQFEDYIKRVDRIYDNIVKRVKAEKNLFRQNVEKVLYDDKYQKIKHYIEKQEFAKVQPRDIGHLMTKMTSQSSNYEIQTFYLNEMKTLDSQITSIFQSVQKLYKKKLKITEHSISKDNHNLKSMTQSLVLRRQDKSKLSNSSSKKQNPSTNRLQTPKIDLSYPQHIDSKIIPYATSINYFIGIKVKAYKLLYRASQNNFQVQQFYKKCVHSSSTIILAKTQHGKVIGGYSRLPWKRSQINLNQSFQSNDSFTKNKGSKFREDLRGSTFMFSVDLNEKYQLLQPKYAIYCGKNTIGFGKNDFRIVNHGHKHSKNLIGFPSSFNNGLYLPIQKSSLVLSGSRHSSHFKIKEWQAFQVIFAAKK